MVSMILEVPMLDISLGLGTVARPCLSYFSPFRAINFGGGGIVVELVVVAAVVVVGGGVVVVVGSGVGSGSGTGSSSSSDSGRSCSVTICSSLQA